MIEYVYSKTNVLMNLTKHVPQRSIAELVLNFIAYDPMFYEEKNQVYQDLKLEVVDKLLQNFSSNRDLEVYEMPSLGSLIRNRF